MNFNKILIPIKALGYPILPIVPECSYCAAMRWALINALVCAIVVGVGSGLVPAVACVLIGLLNVFTLWRVYKLPN